MIVKPYKIFTSLTDKENACVEHCTSQHSSDSTSCMLSISIHYANNYFTLRTGKDINFIIKNKSNKNQLCVFNNEVYVMCENLYFYL